MIDALSRNGKAGQREGPSRQSPCPLGCECSSSTDGHWPALHVPTTPMTLLSR